MPMQFLGFPSVLFAGALAVEIVAAALIDARERRFPNLLAVLLAITCAGFCVANAGFGRLAWHAAAAAATTALLLVVESAWRRAHGGAAGLGGGDIKFLGALMLAGPLYALAAFTVGLVLLAVVGLLARRPALPLLPFVAIGCALALLVCPLPWC